MSNGILIGLIVVLLILIVASLGTGLWFRSQLQHCERSESPYCPQYTCAIPDTDTVGGCGHQAFRFEGNQKICST